MHIVDTIYFWAKTVPHRAAIIQTGLVTTFQGLADAIESIGERIDRLNLDKNEPVAVCLANPSFMLATVFALLRGGYHVAPVNSRLYPHLAGAGLRNLIYDTEGQVTSGGRNIRFDVSWLPRPRQPATTGGYRKCPVENPSLIFFTSGTTGLPKKVVQPAAALNQRLTSPFACGAGAYQKVLIMPDLTITFGFNFLCEVLNFGKTACFSPADGALPLINLFGVEAVVAATAQALAIVEIKNKNPGYRTDSLKAIFIGGSKIDAEGIARIRTALCRNVINHYGSTEAGTAVRSPFDVLADAPGGLALPWVEVEVVDEAGQQLPAGAEGLLRLRTPQLIESLKAAGPDGIPGVRDGWFYPGDIGSVDDDGVLRLAGRSSDVINRGGIKVSGTRIEEILQTFPEIREAAVCSVAGPSGLEEIWIGVVANGSINIEQIKTRLREHDDIRIAPDEVIVLDELPRGELGKVQKPRLKELMLGVRRSG